MTEAVSKIYNPASLTELFNDWRAPDAFLYTQGAYWIQRQEGRFFSLPNIIISLEGIEELQKIKRSERFLEVGAMVTLSRILSLGKIVPEALRFSIQNTSNYLLRNTTTIGSCIFKENTPAPVIAGLAALDARYELRSAHETRRTTAAQFLNSGGNKVEAAKECLVKVQIPLEIWDYTLCRDFSDKESGDNGNEFAVFLAHIQKDILSEMRIIFSGRSILRNRDSELTLIGKKLPLDKKTILNFIELWHSHLETINDRSDFQKSKLMNFLGSSIHYFAY